MNSELKITTEQIQRPGKDPVTVFHLQGWLDAQSEERFLAAAVEAHTAGARYLIVDLENIDTLTSAGMRAIQKVYQQFVPVGQPARMKLCSAPPPVYHVLSIAGFLKNLPMYESLHTALASFES